MTEIVHDSVSATVDVLQYNETLTIAYYPFLGPFQSVATISKERQIFEAAVKFLTASLGG